MRSRLIRVASALLCLIPFTLLTGPFFPDLFLVVINIIFLIISIREKDWFFYNNNYFKIFILFYLYLILSSIISDNPLFSLQSTLPYIRFGIFPLAVWFLIKNNNKLIELFAKMIFITFIIASVDGYYQYYNSISFFGFTAEGIRMTLTLNDNAALGSYLVRLLPLLIAVYFFSFKNSTRNIFIIIAIFFSTSVLIYLSGERPAFALMIISSIFMILFSFNLRKILLSTFIAVIFMILLVTYFDSNIRDRNINTTFNQLGIGSTDGLPFSENNELTVFSPIHESHILGAINMFIENKFFGVGANQFRNLCSHEKYNINIMTCSTHPHNTYIQLLAETGIIGFIIFLIPIIYLISKIFRHLRCIIFSTKPIISDYQLYLITCFVITLFPLLPTQNIFNNWINIIYFLPLGFYLSSVYENNSS